MSIYGGLCINIACCTRIWAVMLLRWVHPTHVPPAGGDDQVQLLRIHSMVTDGAGCLRGGQGPRSAQAGVLAQPQVTCTTKRAAPCGQASLKLDPCKLHCNLITAADHGHG